MITRRTALAGLAALAATPAMPRPARAAAPVLRAAPATVQLVPEGYPATPVWAFGGTVPGPEIRVRKGGRVTRDVVNGLDRATAVHWHGIRIANAMDGVPGLTQDPVPPGGRFLYDFAVPDAGTYWYHSHLRSFEQVARGLAGPLIVEEDTPPEVDADLTLVLDDWLLDEKARLHEGFGDIRTAAHGGRIGPWITVNGDPAWTRETPPNARLRVRLINAATARIFSLEARGLSGAVVALDGQPLATPGPLGPLILAPAQRADLIVDVTADSEALIVSHEREGTFAIASFPVSGDRARPAPLGAVAPLAPNEHPALGDTATARRATLRMDGGAMSALPSASLDGESHTGRQLAERGYVWALNGRADRGETPLFEAARGETWRLAIENATAWPHAMHLHGHHFRALGEAGPGPLRDTLLVRPRETAEILLVADNPGDWLLHCHMLAHAAAGMTAWFRVG